MGPLDHISFYNVFFVKLFVTAVFVITLYYHKHLCDSWLQRFGWWLLYCIKQSCISDISKMNLSTEQKQIIKKLYKNGGKIVRSKAHIHFLSKCLEFRLIPTKFKLKNSLPGNKIEVQEKLNKVSFESMMDEKKNHVNTLKGANLEFEKCKSQLVQVLDAENVTLEL